MTKELLVLFITNAIINQYQPVAILYQQATHRPVAKIVIIRRVDLIPYGFGHYSKHSSTIQFKVSGVNSIKIHKAIRGFLTRVCKRLTNNNSTPPIIKNIIRATTEFLIPPKNSPTYPKVRVPRTRPILSQTS